MSMPVVFFFGGKRLEKGPLLYRSWPTEYLGNIKRAFVMAVYTGLGKWGQESLFLERSPRNEGGLSAPMGQKVSSDPTQEGVAFHIRGGFANVFDVLQQQPEVYMISQEFGTYFSLRVLHALREENRFRHYGPATVAHPVKVRLKEAAAPESSKWRVNVIRRGVSLANNAILFLSG